nr:DsbA family protein [Novosphingobium hassiacum]
MAGNSGPTTREMPLKHRWARADLAFWAEGYGVPLKPPSGYSSGRANAGFVFASDRHVAGRYVDVVWDAIWGQGAEMASDDRLSRVAETMGWDQAEFLDFSDSPTALECYERSTRNAHLAGIFGVPTTTFRDGFWWGNDRLGSMDEALADWSKATGQEPS